MMHSERRVLAGGIDGGLGRILDGRPRLGRGCLLLPFCVSSSGGFVNRCCLEGKGLIIFYLCTI